MLEVAIVVLAVICVGAVIVEFLENAKVRLERDEANRLADLFRDRASMAEEAYTKMRSMLREEKESTKVALERLKQQIVDVLKKEIG